MYNSKLLIKILQVCVQTLLMQTGHCKSCFVFSESWRRKSVKLESHYKGDTWVPNTNLSQFKAICYVL